MMFFGHHQQQLDPFNLNIVLIFIRFPSCVSFGICRQIMIFFYCLCRTDVCRSGGELFDLVADEEFHLTEGQVYI